jgi:ferrous iron transport protein B
MSEPAQAPRPLSAWSPEQVERILRESSDLTAKVLKPLSPANAGAPQKAASEKPTSRERTRRLDRVLLHPVFGLVLFAAIMTGLFSSIFWAATPLMDAVDGAFSYVADQLLAVSPHNLGIQFLANGVIASAGAVLVFIPQIFILFVGIILLEDSGYLARSATLVDKPLAKLGLGGRSFVPLLSGYACAVPAMMAARTINSRKERWLTLFVVPLMSCSARLPVYALLLSFLFHGEGAWKAGLALAAIYLGSLVVGGIASLIASRFVKMDDQSFFMMELPVYRRPRASLVLRQALMRTKSYVQRAGFPIFVFALIVWLGTTFPNYTLEDKTLRLNTSYAAQLGQAIEPVFEPMGGDWRTGVGLISAFAAREVFVSSLAVVFQIADEDEATMQDTLLAKMQEAKAPDGYPLFTVATVLGLIVFFMIALQCLSTVMVAFRESGGWKFALAQLAIFNVVAYLLAVGIVQGLRAIGIS